MTTEDYKEKLVEQYNQTVVTLQQLQGAIAACNELLNSEDEELVPDDNNETDA